LFDLTLSMLLIRLVVLLPIIALYGWVTVLAARLLGEPGPAQDGRQTLNPLAHLDIMGAVCFLLFGLGWMAPLDISPDRLRGQAGGVLAMMLAGFIALLLLAFIAILLLPFAANLGSLSGAGIAGSILIAFCRLGVSFALFNLLPLPKLGGQYLLWAIFPTLADWTKRYGLAIGAVLLLLVATGIFGRLIDPLEAVIVRAISGDTAVLGRTV